MPTTVPTWATPRLVPCLTVNCGDCKHPYGEDDVPWHFENVEQAVRVLTRESGWTIQGDQAVCSWCTEVRLCLSMGGHEWRRDDLGHRPVWSCVDCPRVTVEDPGGEG